MTIFNKTRQDAQFNKERLDPIILWNLDAARVGRAHEQE